MVRWVGDNNNVCILFAFPYDFCIDYLNAFAFFDPRLLISLPVSLVKYPLSFLVKDPVPVATAFAILAFLNCLSLVTLKLAFCDPLKFGILLRQSSGYLFKRILFSLISKSHCFLPKMLELLDVSIVATFVLSKL